MRTIEPRCRLDGVSPAYAARLLACIASLLLCTAVTLAEPKWYLMPRQVVMPSGAEPTVAATSGERLLLDMSDQDANAHILSDVFSAPAGSEWRFTGLHPQFQLRVNDPAHLTLYVRVFNHDAALGARGPVSLTIRVNGKSLPSRRLDTPGDQECRWPLAEKWLETTGDVEIAMDVDPPWRRSDGRNYGILLHSIGFERTESGSVVPKIRLPLWLALFQVAAMLFAAAFTFVVSVLLGKSILKWLRIDLYRCEELFFGFVVGAALLSTLVFILSVLRLAYSWIFFMTGCAIIAIAWKYGAMQFTRRRRAFPLTPKWTILLFAIYSVFAALYFVTALCPESSADGAAFHVAFPALYLRQHRIPAITTNLLTAIPEGVEMLYLFAFSFGKHSATAMVHLLFTLATPLAMFSYGNRFGSSMAGAVGGLLFFLSPATAVSGTAAYVDVAAAAVVFAVFYLVQIWRDEQQDALLIPIGLLAGFAFAIKYPAGIAIVYAGGAVVLRRRQLHKTVWRPVVIVVLFASAIMSPWIAKNIVVMHNPFAPLGNAFFPNPYVSVAMERAYVHETGSLGGLRASEWPYEITSRGAHTQGFLGPIFLLAPVALLAFRTPVGRQLLCAAAIFALPYAAAAPVRYLLPALTFVALAMALVLSRWKYVAAGVVILHAAVSWPQVIPKYAQIFGPPGPRLEMPDWRAALRLTPESAYLEEHCYGEERVDGYGIGLLLDSEMKPGERALAFRGFQQAYHSRDVLIDWESAAGVRLGELVRGAVDPSFQPTEQHRFSFPAVPLKKIRLLQVGRRPTAEQWSVNEIRFFNNGIELTRSPEWRVRASPNEWDAPLAFDNNPLTRWASRQPPYYGMYIEIDFGRPQTVDGVAADGVPGQEGIEMNLQSDTGTGKWEITATRHEVVQTDVAARLRRAAAENLLKQNVQWLVVNDQDPGARDFLLRQPQWGIKLAGASERYRLYHVESHDSDSASAAASLPISNAPLQLDGFYELENRKFRWTKQYFSITFAKPSGPGTVRLVLSLYIADSTIQKLGSITLKARLGDHVLAPATYRETGQYTFERELPSEWLRSVPNRFEFALDKSTPPTPTDGRELGIIVMSAVLQK